MPKKVWENPRYQAKQAAKAERRDARRATRQGRLPSTHIPPYAQPYGHPYGHLHGQSLGQLPSGRALQALPAPAGHRQQQVAQQYPGAQLPSLGMRDGVATYPTGMNPAMSHGLVPIDPYGLRVPQEGPVGLAEHMGAAGRWVGLKAWECVGRGGGQRWNLTPAAASLGLAAGAAVDPAAVIVATAATSGVAGLIHWKGPDQFRGRTWLSRLERGLIWKWGIGATAWATGVAVGGWEPASVAGVVALGITTGAQSVGWLRSRRIRNESENAGDSTDDKELSPEAWQLFNAWPETVGQNGPRSLQGSYIVLDTLKEPVPGTIAFSVELDESVHAEDAVSTEIRKYLERKLRMGVGTVELEINRDDAGQVRVTLTPGRHLEKVAAIWEGPILREDGTIPLAVTSDGRDVDAGLFNASGVEHAGIFGTTNVGKSYTLAAMVLAGVFNKREVVVYVDGGLGSSAAHLAGACDWYAVSGPEEWAKAIMTVHTVMRSRKERRAKAGISKWRGLDEDIPAITLVIDEATTVKSEIDHLEGKVLEILREGRKHGVRVIEVSQDPMGTDLMGGRQARGLMAGGGTLIGHRPGDNTANTLAGSGSSEKIDLRALPPEPGWCGIIRMGQVQAARARVRYASEEKVLSALEGFEPLSLTGEDRIAAGAAYVGRVRGSHAAAEMRGEIVAPSATPELEPTSPPAATDDVPPASSAATVAAGVSSDTPEPGSSASVGAKMLTGAAALNRASGMANRSTVLGILEDNHAGVTKAGIVTQLEQLKIELSDRTVRRALDDLRKAGKAYEAPAGVWHAGASEEAA